MSTNKILTGLICGTLYCFSAVAQTMMATPADKDFLAFAAQTDMTEAHFGQLAQDQSSNQNVKDFGQMLIQDHTKDYNTISAMALKMGTEVPKGINDEHMKLITPVAKLKGKSFDRHFLATMIKGHEKAISMFKKEADTADNAQLKAYATATLPTLEKHLQSAQQLAGPMAKSMAK